MPCRTVVVSRSYRTGTRTAMVMMRRRRRGMMVMPWRRRRGMMVMPRRRRRRPVISRRRRGRRYYVNHGHIRRRSDYGFGVAVVIAVINENAACQHGKSYCHSSNGNY